MTQLSRWPSVEGKGPEWHTAFYYLAEHVRALTGGAVNHKVLYALVGVDGRYVNHANPIARRRMAGALSRTIHSGRYVGDMAARHRRDSAALDRAAKRIAHIAVQVSHAAGWDGACAYLLGSCWPDVRRGLSNERHAWRGDLDLARIDREMEALAHAAVSGDDETDAAHVLAAQLHLIAFGHLSHGDARLSRELPLSEHAYSARPAWERARPCLQ